MQAFLSTVQESQWRAARDSAKGSQEVKTSSDQVLTEGAQGAKAILAQGSTVRRGGAIAAPRRQRGQLNDDAETQATIEKVMSELGTQDAGDDVRLQVLNEAMDANHLAKPALASALSNHLWFKNRRQVVRCTAATCTSRGWAAPAERRWIAGRPMTTLARMRWCRPPPPPPPLTKWTPW